MLEGNFEDICALAFQALDEKWIEILTLFFFNEYGNNEVFLSRVSDTFFKTSKPIAL